MHSDATPADHYRNHGEQSKNVCVALDPKHAGVVWRLMNCAHHFVWCISNNVNIIMLLIACEHHHHYRTSASVSRARCSLHILS